MTVLEGIIRFVDHDCLEVVVSFDYIGGFIGHHC